MKVSCAGYVKSIQYHNSKEALVELSVVSSGGCRYDSPLVVLVPYEKLPDALPPCRIKLELEFFPGEAK